MTYCMPGPRDFEFIIWATEHSLDLKRDDSHMKIGVSYTRNAAAGAEGLKPALASGSVSDLQIRDTLFRFPTACIPFTELTSSVG